jgi:hypothetical protein
MVGTTGNKMNLLTFINDNVNQKRGGYRPDEVVELIRKAWHEARNEVKTEQQETKDELLG